MVKSNCLVDIMNGVLDEPRPRIFKAAIEEFAKRSYDGARTRVIAEKAGVNHAAISYYFGGKNGLYMEIIKELTDFIELRNIPFIEREKKVCNDAIKAKSLFLDILMEKVATDETLADLWPCLLLMITHEEIGERTEAYEILFEKIFKPTLELLSRLLKVISEGTLTDEDACIYAHMMFGQIHIFNYSRTGFKRVANWKNFSEEEILKLRKKFEFMLNKIFKKQ